MPLSTRDPAQWVGTHGEDPSGTGRPIVAVNADPIPRLDTARASEKRSRRGCATCRARRVKCDEQQPVCGECARRKDECTWTTIVQSGSATHGSAAPQAQRKRAAACVTCRARKVGERSASPKGDC
ncbi:hypothetical protein JCM24511_07166 [Saitozyma sp. JCM 24511]|nr:hypothetical protein JCM24511_07166 [Saitozyma sp. JCM 24511]